MIYGAERWATTREHDKRLEMRMFIVEMKAWGEMDRPDQNEEHLEW